jgi:hypothetical protein
VFETPEGKAIPYAVEDIAVQLIGETTNAVEAEMLRNAALAVLYFFKHELGKETITVAEFSQALERVLRGFGLKLAVGKLTKPSPLARIADSDLRRLACASGHGCELVFFPLLRAELQRQVKDAPTMVRFSGLRGCVKQLLGARRWSPGCQRLSDHIVDYLRTCFGNDFHKPGCALVVQ